MASPAAPSEQQQQVPQIQVDQQEPVTLTQDGNALQGQMEGLDVNAPAPASGLGSGSELHVACAEGKLEDVRSVLSRSLDSLETLDMATGCTPIVLAIRGNHHDVVRELLSAGAIVPPPGLTNDPLMLSVLYPHAQQMYGIPPQFMGMPPQEYYPQPNFFPGQHQHLPPHMRKDGSPNGPLNGLGAAGQNNLPPAEVSKTIPCRNFPNCKYGSSCVFYHPRPQQQQQQQQQFFPGPGGPVPGPNGFEGYSAPYPPSGPYFVPQNGSFNPAQPYDPSQQQPETIPEHSATTQHDQTQNETQTQTQAQPPAQHVPSAVAPVFIPGFQPQSQPNDMMSPPPPSQFGLSPLSPSMLGSSLPSIPPAEAFFAQSPPNGYVPVPQANGHARRQSFNQQQQFGGKPLGHGKKPSFSGGPKPWLGRPPMANGSAKLGSWKDGNPPPCAFFAQGNCRNGEYCKFPHIDAEGNDCRHPDIIRGIIAPVPTLPRQPRGMRMMGPGFGPFDPSFRQQQHQQQIQFLQHQRMAAAQAQQGTAAPAADGESNTANGEAPEKHNGDVAETSESSPAPDAESEQTSSAAPTLPASVPSKPATATATAAAAPSAATPVPAIVRSASQPGVQRVHANGLSSRSHSPAPSNVSFHGNGHPRRARMPQMNGHAHGHAHANANANGAGRSTSNGHAEKAKPSQRIPGAHEFPALGTPTNEKKEPQFPNAGKTAAQVLSAPAPPKPAVKVTPAEEDGSDKSDKQSVTMDSESEGDAVIISTKSSGAATPAPAPIASSASTNGKPATSASAPASTPAPAAPAAPAAAAEPKRSSAPISFASVASAVSLPTLESSPVALKA